jgi:UDP-N-acetylmuramoyl-tripeptide--D-alanyl-D-alanine ligase
MDGGTSNNRYDKNAGRMMWTADRVVAATGGDLVAGTGEQQFSGIGIDSRNIDAAALFVAIIGERHNGHDFIEMVLEKGVRGIVMERSHVGNDALGQWRALGVTCIAVDNTTTALGALAHDLRKTAGVSLVAITGSNGKTTTREMTGKIMAPHFDVLATQGNLNNEIGLPLTLFNLASRHQWAVVELGMNHPGEISRLAAMCVPNIGVITNIAPAHLEGLQSVEGVARAKGELLDHITSDGKAVLNADDEHLQQLGKRARCDVCWYGMSPDVHIRAQAVEMTPAGVGFTLCLPAERFRVQLPTHGAFMVTNALAAAAVGHLAGVPGLAIKAGLETFSPVKGRLNIAVTKTGVHYIDDTYNANPKSMAAAIETLTALKAGQRGVAVLGDMLEMGPESAHWHARIGEKCAQADLARLYAAGQFREHIAQGAVAAGMPARDILTGAKEDLLDDLKQWLKPGDWVLVKGSRGMRMEYFIQAIMEVF